MLRIGLIGTGTVGGGVIQILEQKIAEYKEKLGVELELACICAKSEEEVAPYKAKGYKVSTNADEMIADDGKTPFTQHTTNPVPVILVSEEYKNARLASGGVLADLAPTLLDVMGLKKPAKMTGKSLLIR